jgi:hypothetical protein
VWHADSNSNSDGNVHAYTHSYGDVYAYTHSYGDVYTDSDSDCYCYRNSNANAYKHAEGHTNAAAASDAATSSVVRSAKLEPLRPGLARETREFSGWGGWACPQDDAKASSPEAQVLGGIAA